MGSCAPIRIKKENVKENGAEHNGNL